jgi:flagellar basal body-associated protein FliL
MADEEIQSPPEVKENKSKKVLIYGGIGLVQVIIAFVLVYFIIYPKYQEWAQGTGEQEKIEDKKERKPLGLLYTISGLTVNPKDTRGNRFAVFEVVLELEDEEAKTLVSQYEPVIIDQLLGFLRTKTVDELSFHHLTTDIKMEIMRVVNSILVDKKVTNVYFTRFVLE